MKKYENGHEVTYSMEQISIMLNEINDLHERVKELERENESLRGAAEYWKDQADDWMNMYYDREEDT